MTLKKTGLSILGYAHNDNEETRFEPGMHQTYIYAFKNERIAVLQRNGMANDARLWLLDVNKTTKEHQGILAKLDVTEDTGNTTNGWDRKNGIRSYVGPSARMVKILQIYIGQRTYFQTTMPVARNYSNFIADLHICNSLDADKHLTFGEENRVAEEHVTGYGNSGTTALSFIELLKVDIASDIAESENKKLNHMARDRWEWDNEPHQGLSIDASKINPKHMYPAQSVAIANGTPGFNTNAIAMRQTPDAIAMQEMWDKAAMLRQEAMLRKNMQAIQDEMKKSSEITDTNQRRKTIEKLGKPAIVFDVDSAPFNKSAYDTLKKLEGKVDASPLATKEYIEELIGKMKEETYEPIDKVDKAGLMSAGDFIKRLEDNMREEAPEPIDRDKVSASELWEQATRNTMIEKHTSERKDKRRLRDLFRKK